MSDENLHKLLAQVHERLSHAASRDARALESLVVKFQAEHPALADSLRQLADLLGKAGI